MNQPVSMSSAKTAPAPAGQGDAPTGTSTYTIRSSQTTRIAYNRDVSITLNDSLATVTLLNPHTGEEEVVLSISPGGDSDSFPVKLRAQIDAAWNKSVASRDLWTPFHVFERLAEDHGLKAEGLFPQRPFRRPGIPYQSVPDFPFAGSQESLKETSLPPPLMVRDKLTGLLTAKFLDSEDGVADLTKRISGAKALFFIDVNHMGVADKFGLKDNIDTFLSRLSEAAEQTLGKSLKYAMLRIGGDEFAIVIQDTDRVATAKAMTEFISKVNTLKDEHFLPNDDNRVILENAENFAQLRAAVRLLRSQHYKSLHPSERFTCAAYRSWLLAHEGWEEPTGKEGNAAQLSVTLATDILKAAGRRPPVMMTFSVSPGIELAPKLSCDALHTALRTAQYEINRIKETGGFEPDVRVPPNTRLTPRAAELSSSYNAAKADEVFRIHEHHTRLLAQASESDPDAATLLNLRRKELRACAALDPALRAQVFRFNLIKDKQAGDFLNLTQNESYQVIKFDIARYGVLNHVSYQRADAIFNEVAKRVEETLPPGLLMRANGGALYYLTPVTHAVDAQNIRALNNRLNLLLEESITDERSVAEVEEREALENWSKQQFGDSSPWQGERPPFKTVTCASSHVSISPADTIAEIFSELI